MARPFGSLLVTSEALDPQVPRPDGVTEVLLDPCGGPRDAKALDLVDVRPGHCDARCDERGEQRPFGLVEGFREASDLLDEPLGYFVEVVCGMQIRSRRVAVRWFDTTGVSALDGGAAIGYTGPVTRLADGPDGM